MPEPLDLDRMEAVARAATPDAADVARSLFDHTFDPPTVIALIARARLADQLQAELEQLAAEKCSACEEMERMASLDHTLASPHPS